MPTKTRRMSRASQVVFANAYLEKQGIEAQTVDVHALIDGTLSYEENLKAIKRHVGHGGRSKQKAARGLSAAECDVAIGNCAAGFLQDCKDACKCGDPDACEKKRAAKPKTKPKTTKKVNKTVKPQTTKRKKRSAQKTMSGKTKPQKKPKKRVKKCVRVKVKPHTRTCPTTTR